MSFVVAGIVKVVNEQNNTLDDWTAEIAITASDNHAILSNTEN